MGGDYSFYKSSKYGLDSDEAVSPLGFEYGKTFSAGDFGLTVDGRTAHQLKAVSDKLSTGTKVVELSAIEPGVLEYTPKQQFKEIERLKKLVGAEITFHGPLIEASGITQSGWDQTKREQVERQLFNAVEKSRMVGENTIFTLHSAHGLPDMKAEVITEENGKKVKKLTELWVVDERDNKFSTLKPQYNFLMDEKPDAEKELKKLNEDTWTKALTQLSFHAHQGEQAIRQALREYQTAHGELPYPLKSENDITNFYKTLQTEEGQKAFQKEFSPEQQKKVNHIMGEVNYGQIYVQDAYHELQNLFNKAWVTAEKDNKKEDLEKLRKYREELQPKIREIRDDPAKIAELGEEVMNGVKLLSTLSETPKIFKPLSEFAIDKSSETYSNLAYKAYKKFGDSAPIISIENPPAGGGLSKAEDLRELVKETRKKFEEQAIKDGLSKSEAKEKAEKFIGATWDVGHINMIRKFGYSKEDVIEQTKIIAPFVKHVHLSDNFGLEHTELPMGMGNVPTKEMLDAISKYNSKVKKIIETGGWYQHFKKSPLTETFQAFGSPVFGSEPVSWTNAYGIGGAGPYFSGYGMNPDIHHNLYGAGFTTLPQELGGQAPGRGGSRFAGNPME